MKNINLTNIHQIPNESNGQYGEGTMELIFNVNIFNVVHICRQCTMGQVEDISHFILQCPGHRHLRDIYIPHESLTNSMTNVTFLRNLTIFITKALKSRT
jgi:hypothetical protein